MRVVLGLSLTASSAVWAVVDTATGKILAEEVVAIDSLHEIARATARSIQTFDLRADNDVEGVRMTWSDDARPHGIRLRTKLRLYGFDTVETVSQEAARAGRNKTARHLAPHVGLAYGAARSDGDTDTDLGALRRLTARVPIRATAGVGAAAVTVVAIFAFASRPSETPATMAAETMPLQSAPPVAPAPVAAKPAPPAAGPSAAPVAQPVAVPSRAPNPVTNSEPVADWQPVATVVQPETAVAPGAITDAPLDSTVPELIPPGTEGGQLPAAQPVGTPLPVAAQPVGTPLPVAAQPVGTPLPVAGPPPPPGVALAPPAPGYVAPPPLPPVISELFGALP